MGLVSHRAVHHRCVSSRPRLLLRRFGKARIIRGEIRRLEPWRRSRPQMKLTYEAIAKRIDHSLLSPTLTEDELEEGCRLAARYRVASVCIKPYAVPLATEI